jgi:DNA uptake protein ComE-like DNA-binding protein
MPRIPLALALAAALAACGGDAEPEEAAVPATDAAATPAPAETPAPAAPAADGALVNPNDATREQLVAAGVDAAAADRLVAGRPFADMRAVDAALAESMDEGARENVYRAVWLPLDLNTATAEEIMLIPGMDARMRHEFEEYRPYRGMDQFRQEIGKYVDEAEVARLERYVTIR